MSALRMPKRVRDVHAPAISQRPYHSSRRANRPPVFERTTRAPECRNNAVCLLWCGACENLRPDRQWLHAYSNNRSAKSRSLSIPLDQGRWKRKRTCRPNAQAYRPVPNELQRLGARGSALADRCYRSRANRPARHPPRRGRFRGAGVVAKDGKRAGACWIVRAPLKASPTVTVTSS